MRKRTLDCVELQHRGGARLQALLEGMTAEEEERFWAELSAKLRAEQEEAVRRRSADWARASQ